MHIRDCAEADIASLEDIYAHYVATSIATFEETDARTTDLTDILRNLRGKRLPFLVGANADGQILGFAYAKHYHTRAAYRYTVGNSVYIRTDFAGKGLGGRLTQALIERLKQAGFKQIIAVMSIMPEVDIRDHPSCRMHAALGFQQAGRVKKVGYKFDQWIDVVYYQLDLTA